MKTFNKISKTSQFNQKSEQGRSMVEMLATLAVMGILAITGIVVYSYAMKKYEANKIANEMNVVSNQIMQIMSRNRVGELDLSLGNPYDDGNLTSAVYEYSFGCGIDSESIAPCPADEIAYYQRIDGVPQEVCQSLVQLTQHLPHLVEQQVNGAVDITGSQCVESEAGNKIILFFETDKGGEVGADCPASRPVYNKETGRCEPCPADNPKWDGQECRPCPEGTEWNAKMKECVNPDIKCKTNAHCNDNEYCRAYTSNCNVEVITYSYCNKLNQKNKNPNSTTPYVASDGTMTWFSAVRFCQRMKDMGKVSQGVLIAYEDLQCDSKEPIGHCYKESELEDSPTNPENSGSEYSNVSPIVKELYKGYGDAWIWTSRLFNNVSDSCYAYSVRSSNGLLTTGSGRQNHLASIAVCK